MKTYLCHLFLVICFLLKFAKQEGVRDCEGYDTLLLVADLNGWQLITMAAVWSRAIHLELESSASGSAKDSLVT